MDTAKCVRCGAEGVDTDKGRIRWSPNDWTLYAVASLATFSVFGLICIAVTGTADLGLWLAWYAAGYAVTVPFVIWRRR